MAVYSLVDAVFTHGSVTSRCQLNPQLIEVVEMLPGQPNAGGYHVGQQRRGARFTRMNGVVFELRGQTGSGSAVPEDDILQAMGFDRSGTTEYTYTLADPHLSTATPAGKVDPISTCELNIDGQQWDMANVIANGVFNWSVGQIPIMTVDFLGEVPSGDATITTAIRKAAAADAVTVGPLPLAWLGSTVGILPAGGARQTSNVVTDIELRINNVLNMRKSAGGTYGVAGADIPKRDPCPSLSITMEMPSEAANFLFEDYRINGNLMTIDWTDVHVGTTNKTWTNTFIGYIVDVALPDVNNGHAGYTLTLEQDLASAQFTRVNS